MEKKWFIGIDVSKKTFDAVIYDRKRQKVDESIHRQFTNDRDGYRALRSWFAELGVRKAGLVVGMENTGIYSMGLCLWLERGGYDYCCFNPLHLKRSMGLVRGKSDRVDAWRIAYHCHLHREELSYTHMKDSTVLRLHALFSERKRHEKHVAEYKGYLTDREGRKGDSTLKRTRRALDFEQKMVQAIEREMEELIEGCEELRRNYGLLLSIRGIGPVNAIATIIHTGNFTCFENARKYACYIGVAPFEETSGTSLRRKPRVCAAGARGLKTDLSMAARSAIIHDAQMKAYFERKTAEGKHFGVVLNAVKYKMVQRMFAVVRRGTPFVPMMTYKC